MQIAVLVFDGLTALDAIGPIEVLGRLPGAELKLVAQAKGSIRCGESSSHLRIAVDASLAELTAPDVLVVPGGFGTRAFVHDEGLLEWIRQAHEATTWTTSVCTGALLLGAAGLLEGLCATTHWRASDQLASFGAIPVTERVVEEGKVITAAGVSSGIDMALRLAARIAGDAAAQAIQLQIEYDPEPPFDSGSLAKASAEVRRLAGAS